MHSVADQEGEDHTDVKRTQMHSRLSSAVFLAASMFIADFSTRPSIRYIADAWQIDVRHLHAWETLLLYHQRSWSQPHLKMVVMSNNA